MTGRDRRIVSKGKRIMPFPRPCGGAIFLTLLTSKGSKTPQQPPRRGRKVQGVGQQSSFLHKGPNGVLKRRQSKFRVASLPLITNCRFEGGCETRTIKRETRTQQKEGGEKDRMMRPGENDQGKKFVSLRTAKTESREKKRSSVVYRRSI